MNNALKLITFLSILTCSQSYARYDKTLPKGVRLLAIRQVQTNDVRQFHNFSGNEESYSANVKIDSQALSEIDAINEFVLSDLQTTSPEAYNKLNAASYKFDVQANVNVTGIGFGYGINNNLTFYGVIPYYRAKINVKTQRVEGNNYQEVNSLLQESNNKTGLVLDMNSLPDVDEGLVQSVIQNYYGYEPLGVWEAKGLGDIDLGIKYRYASWKNGGALVDTGINLATGRVDNPDIIQDFGFGDGHWGLFTETGIGQSFGDFDFSLSTRFDLALAASKELRPSETNSDFQEDKLLFQVSPGLKTSINGSATYKYTDWLSFTTGLLYESKNKDKYESTNSAYDFKLENISFWSAYTLKASIEASSVDLYLKDEFVAPLSFAFMVDKVLGGVNVPDTTLYSADLRLFF